MAGACDKWVEKFWARELPVMTRTEIEMLRLKPKAETLSAQELATIIQHDPMMSLNVLQLANSRHKSRFGAEITTVEHAIMMLGVTPFFTHFSQLERLEEQYRERPKILDRVRQLISRSYHAATYAWNLAALRKDIKAEELFVAALLADLGELLLWLLEPETAEAMERLARKQGMTPETAQQEILGCTLHELTMAIAPHWRIPDLLLSLMEHTQTNNPRCMVVCLSVMVAHHSEQGWYHSALDADYEAIASFMHMHADEVVSEIHQTAVRLGRAWEWFKVPPMAAWLPLLPGEWPKTEPDASAATDVPAEAEVCLMPQHDKLEQAMREIDAHLDQTLDLQGMIALVLKGMHDGIGLNRVLFALYTPDRARLRAKFVLGAEPDSPLRKFDLDMRGKHLFSMLMEKMQGVWYRDANKANLDALIPPMLREQIGEGEFFAMSLFVHGKPAALIYADRRHGSCRLDEHSYAEFKRLSLRAAEGLAHLAKKQPAPE